MRFVGEYAHSVKLVAAMLPEPLNPDPTFTLILTLHICECSGSGDLHSQLAENRDLLAERGQKLERLQDRTAMMESDAGV